MIIFLTLPRVSHYVSVILDGNVVNANLVSSSLKYYAVKISGKLKNLTSTLFVVWLR